MSLTVGSLFSGIGGIDLGLERAGMTVRWQAETDPYAARVLAKHWPHVPNLGDVTKIDWENDGLDHGDGIARSLHVDLICGGFPCQPVSVAGRRRGQADERWLWPEVARCLRLLRPRWALLENVPGLLVQPMGDVLGDLATLGYDTEWQGIPAAAVGAPHLRWRIFIVAHTQRHGWGPADRDASGVGGTATAEEGRQSQTRRTAQALDGCGAGTGDVAHADHAERRPDDPEGCDLREERPDGLQGREEVSGRPRPRREDVADPDRPRRLERRGTVAVRAQQRTPQCGGEDVDDAHGRRYRSPQGAVFAGGHGPVASGWWESEPDVGRVAHGVPSRVDRLRCLGNAVVPQVAEYVGRRLLAHVDGQESGGGVIGESAYSVKKAAHPCASPGAHIE